MQLHSGVPVREKSDDDIILVRTHRFGQVEENLCKQLAKVFGKKNVVICADETRGLLDTGKWQRSSLTPDRVRDMTGGSVPPDWGWRMGDLCHIAVHEDFGPRPRQWLIENDVHIPKGHETEIFTELSAIQADFMACNLQRKKVKSIAEGVTAVLPGAEWGCIFAFNRLNGEHVTDLQKLRQRLAIELPRTRHKVPNDEAVLANLSFYSNWKMVDLFEAAPDIFAKYWFDTNPPMLREHIERQTGSKRVTHPVLGYDMLLQRLTDAAQSGHPQAYKEGRLGRVLSVLPERERNHILSFVRPNANQSTGPNS